MTAPQVPNKNILPGDRGMDFFVIHGKKLTFPASILKTESKGER